MTTAKPQRKAKLGREPFLCRAPMLEVAQSPRANPATKTQLSKTTFHCSPWDRYVTHSRPKVTSFYTSSFPGCKPEGPSFFIEKEGAQFLIAPILLNLTCILLALTTKWVSCSLTTYLTKTVAVPLVKSTFTYVLVSVTQKSQHLQLLLKDNRLMNGTSINAPGLQMRRRTR